MGRKRSKHELRCFCRYQPLLAVYGLADGKIYVHVRIYKSGRVYGELYIEGGTVRLRCRDCLRWHKVIIRQPGMKAALQESQSPPVISVEAAGVGA